MSPPIFTKLPHLGSLQEGQEALEDACELDGHAIDFDVVV